MQDTQLKSNFKIGKVLFTRGVNDLVAENNTFAKGVTQSLARYFEKDWGDLCDDDKKMNDDASKYGDRILARYKIEPQDIYIITEWDRSYTTILFPSEY